MFRGLKPGAYTIEIVKNGYQSYTETIQLQEGTVRTVETGLAGRFFYPLFPLNDSIVVNRTRLFGNNTNFQIPHGTYSINQEEDSIYIDPVYPRQGLLTALHITLPIMAVISGILTAENLLNPRQGGTTLTAATWTSYAVTAGVLALDIGLAVQKSRFLSKFPVAYSRKEGEIIPPMQIFQKGEDMLARDRFDESLDYYTAILVDHKDSSYYPFALYKTARIHFILREYELSLEEFKIVQRTYPLPELYDKACKNIADIYFFLGDYEKSRNYLDEMIFVDPLYSKEAIDFYKAQIIERIYQETGDSDILSKLIDAYAKLADAYPESENLGQYQFLHANYLFFANKFEKALDLLDSIGEEGTTMIDSVEALKQEIRRTQSGDDLPATQEADEEDAGNTGTGEETENESLP